MVGSDTVQQERSESERSKRLTQVPLRSGVFRRAHVISEGPARTAVARRDRIYRRSLVVADAVAALSAVYVAATVLGPDRVQLRTLLAIPIVVGVSKLMGLYDRDELLLRKTTLDEAPALFQLAAFYTLIVWLTESQLLYGALGKEQAVVLWVCLFGFSILARTAARMVAGSRSSVERCLVVGDFEGTGTIERKLGDGRGLKAELVAQLPLTLEHNHAAELQVLELAIREHDVHRVILAPHAADSDAMLDAIRLVKSLGVKVSLLPRLFEVIGSSVVFDDLNGVTLLGVRRFGLTRSSGAVKRSMDLVGATVGLLAVAPVIALIAAAVKLDARGPCFFRQTRVGREGKRFEMLKFRTMVDGADAMKAPLRGRSEADGLFKIANDPRITRVGRILRKTSLDELPQLINVLVGDMSLVGPRPLVLDEDSKVQGWHRRRLHLTPGMTGHWQILGSSRIPLHEMVKIDYLYIANWSLWTDVKIMLRTVPYMVRGGSM